MPGLISFSATRRLTGSACSANQTTPNPPSPRISSSRYRPTRLPPSWPDTGRSDEPSAATSALSAPNRPAGFRPPASMPSPRRHDGLSPPAIDDGNGHPHSAQHSFDIRRGSTGKARLGLPVASLADDPLEVAQFRIDFGGILKGVRHRVVAKRRASSVGVRVSSSFTEVLRSSHPRIPPSLTILKQTGASGIGKLHSDSARHATPAGLQPSPRSSQCYGLIPTWSGSDRKIGSRRSPRLRTRWTVSSYSTRSFLSMGRSPGVNQLVNGDSGLNPERRRREQGRPSLKPRGRRKETRVSS